MVHIPSPAISIVGRHNSGKTTLIVKLISELVSRGLDVGSVKHHSHVGFDIDYPGKDSYRHREAGASETVIAAPGQMARIKTIKGEVECCDIVRDMPGHDVVVVEGYRKSGLPTIEVMRAANPADARVAAAFVEGAREGRELGTDFVQASRAGMEKGRAEIAAEAALAAAVAAAMAAGESEERARELAADDLARKMPSSDTVAIVTDIPEAREAAEIYGIPAFPVDDVIPLADFVERHYARPHITVVIQAGGESRRMGRSKATVPFAGRPLICRLIERLAPAADELVITTNEGPNLEFLHDLYEDLDIKLVPDEYDYRGALPGLYTALKAASHPYVAIVACDMVFASASLIVSESIVMNEFDSDVVVPVNKHGFEPFHALYRKEACLPAIEARLAEGEKRAQSFFDDVNVYEFSQQQVLEAEPMGGCFINANTPDELKALEEGFLD